MKDKKLSEYIPPFYWEVWLHGLYCYPLIRIDRSDPFRDMAEYKDNFFMFSSVNFQHNPKLKYIPVKRIDFIPYPNWLVMYTEVSHYLGVGCCIVSMN